MAIKLKNKDEASLQVLSSVATRPPPYFKKDTILRVLKIVDFDLAFSFKSSDPIIINKFDCSASDYQEQISKAIHSEVRVGDIDFVARCECGRRYGNYYYGSICPKCNTEVRYDTFAADGHLSHKAWVSCPEDIEGGWINPQVFWILARWLKYGPKVPIKYVNKTTGEIANKNKARKGNLLEDILDVNTEIPEELSGVIDGKGFTYFYRNFDRLMHFFLTQFKGTANKPGCEEMAYFIQQNRDKIFCRHIPVLSSALHPIIMAEGSSDKRNQYIERHAQFVNKAAGILSSLAFSPWKRRNPKTVESDTFKAYQCMLAYDYEIALNHLSKKKAIPRQSILGSRLHFTFRGPIVQITRPHKLDELELPWSIGVNLLRPHIVGRLMQQGMCAADAMQKQQFAIQRYDPDIDKMMQDFIKECPYKGLPVWFNRNPSIRPGSIMLLFVTKIKPNPRDKTIGFSANAVSPPNADYDGDFMNGVLIIEIDAVPDFMAMHPANLYLSTNEASVSSMFKIPVPLLMNANSFLGMN